MFAAQCMLAVFVALGDLPKDAFGDLPGSAPALPTTDVPITPGNQTREFQPNRLPVTAPTGPGFPADEFVPRRLEFTPVEIDGVKDAVLITGTIAAGDAGRFEDWLQARPALPEAFLLHSPGGSVRDALQIGQAIRTADLKVMVAAGASCFSACPYILAGGAQREVSRTALVGVHQHYFGENTYLPAFLLVSDIQAGQGEVMAYLDTMGIDPMVMSKALMTPPEDIYILTPEELETFRLATRLSD